MRIAELEGLPLTILEASAIGIPVLAQPKSAMPEAVTDDVTGWILPVDPIQSWVDKLVEISHWSAIEQRSFTAKSRAFVAQHYSWDVVAQQYAELYHRIAQAA